MLLFRLQKYLFIFRNMVDESAIAGFVIYPTAIVIDSIADNQKFYTKYYIVPGYLVKSFLGDIYVGRLVFYYCTRGPEIVVYNGIAAFPATVQIKGYFIAYTSGRIFFLLYYVFDKMLSDNLFGSYRDIFLAQLVEYVFPSVLNSV